MQGRRKLLRAIYPSYVAITLLALAAVGVYAARSFRQAYIGEVQQNLTIRARLVSAFLEREDLAGNPGEMETLLRNLRPIILTRVTVIGGNGKVLADSDEASARMENHGHRPEVLAAFTGATGKDIRHSHTLGKDMLYVAVPMTLRGEKVVVRVARPLKGLSETLRDNYFKIALAGLIAAVMAVGMSWLVARRLGRAVNRLMYGARRFAEGDLFYRIRELDSEEFGSLAQTMNQMASELEDRIRTVTNQKNELEVMLGAMVEAVLVVDLEERIVKINRAAAGLLALSPEDAFGKPVEEAVRNVSLLRFVSRALAGDGPAEDELTIFVGGEERKFLAHGNLLRNARGMKTHALIALHDVTRLQKLETIRRDFVANVSHELKTPLTSIKGAVETLSQGVDADAEAKFLDIISRHVGRLDAIINDLLSLSRIESAEEKEEIELAPGPVRDVLAAAAALVEKAAAAKDIIIHIECPPELRALMNRTLLEQAVLNLLDNAVKYSEEGRDVNLRAAPEDGKVRISVEDQGPGIPEAHLGRVFERFYRVDKARSRKLGGTGLGLAIVKHIVTAHGGEVEIKSAEGKGSLFSLLLPAA